MYVKLSDLFTHERLSTESLEKPFYHPAGSSLYDDSMAQIESRNAHIREPSSTQHIINGFKQQVKQSLTIINSPKSNLFGHTPIIQWSSQNFFKQTKKIYNSSTKLNTEPIKVFHEQAMKTGFSNPPNSSQRQRRVIDADPLKQAKQILQNGRIDTADWANLKEGIDEQLSRKSHTLNFYPKESSIRLIQDQVHPPKQISMKDRINCMNHQLYKMKVTLGNNLNNSNQKGREDTQSYQYEYNENSSKFGSTSTKFLTKRDQDSIFQQTKRSGKNKTNYTEQTDREYFKTQNTQKPIHKMQSSICMAQIKHIRGGNVKKQDKEKFQHYYDNVSERLHDIKQTRSLNKFEYSKLSDFNWQQIRYQPANEKEDAQLKEIRDLYLRERISNIQNQVEAILTNKEKEEQQRQQKISQQKEGKVIEEYRKKTFFLFKNVEEENEKQKAKAKQELLNQTDDSIDYDKLFSGLHAKEITGHFDKEKFKRVRKQLKEYLQKHINLNLTLTEAMTNGIFKREPFIRPLSEEFFAAVKSNEVEMVQQLLNKDKYLVYQFDYTLQSPLHWAAKRGNMEIAQLLITFNCDVDSKDQLGRTPLFFAYREGHNSMGKLLLLNKATPWSNKKNNVDEMVYSRLSNEKTAIKIAKQIHLMLMMAPFKQKQKLWEDSKYLFDDKFFEKQNK